MGAFVSPASRIVPQSDLNSDFESFDAQHSIPSPGVYAVHALLLKLVVRMFVV